MRHLLSAIMMFVALATSTSFADDWGAIANISATLGVNDSRLCVGEGSRGDLGCPTYAPSLTTTGDVALTGGLTTNNISFTLVSTTWGYIRPTASYLPNFASNAISTSNISLTTINGIPVSSLGGSATVISGTTTMAANFPDAIQCTLGGNTSSVFLYLTFGPASNGMYYYRALEDTVVSNNIKTQVVYDAAGAYNSFTSSGGFSSAGNCATSISALYSAGRAFNFIGSTNAGTGGLGYAITSGTTAATVNSATGIISLTTAGTTWGYLSSGVSYLPAINTGTVQVSGTTASCTGTNAGTIRYTSATTTLELCTGSSWQPIGVGIPAGTISAFASTTCPTGWSEYTPARGRFLRGIDNAAGNDPDGTRAPGATQTDAFQGHAHQYTTAAQYDDLVGGSGTSARIQSTGTTNNIVALGTYGTPRLASETRPKNVAVTYCQFNGTSNGWNNPLSGGSTVPGGATTQIQYNTAGSFDGNAGLTWTNGTQTLAATYISTTNISVTTINGISLSSLGGGGGASPTNVPAFRAHHNNVNFTGVSAAWNKLIFSTKEFDTFSNYSNSTGRYTPTVAGTYVFVVGFGCQGTNCQSAVYKNGVVAANSGYAATGYPNTVLITQMNGTTDYVEAYGYLQGTTTVYGSPSLSYFQGSLLASGNGLVSGTGVSALSSLTDVNITTPVSGSVLTYNGTTSKWENMAATGGLGYAITSGTTAVTVNSATSIISLSTVSTTWGYLGSAASYIPNLNTNALTVGGLVINSSTLTSTTAQVAFKVNKGGTGQSVAATTWTKLTFNTKEIDTNNNFNTSTSRFTPTVAGNYMFIGAAYCTGSVCWTSIYKNGVMSTQTGSNGWTEGMPTTSGIFYMNGTTDYVELYGYANAVTISGAAGQTHFEGFLLSGGAGGVSGSSVGVSAIASLTDVSLSSLTSNSFLVYDGTRWVNRYIQDTISTSTMIPGWPDALQCTIGVTDYTFPMVRAAVGGSAIYRYENGSTIWNVAFSNINANGDQSGSSTSVTNCATTISALYAAGRAFNYIGGSGSGSGGTGYGLTSGTLGLTLNSPTSIISLSTAGTTWGYLGSAASYIPNLSTNALTVGGLTINSSTLVSSTAQVAFSVNKAGANQTVTSNSNTKLTWPNKLFDTNNNFNTSTSRFTPTVAGYYQLHAKALCGDNTAFCQVLIYKNATLISNGYQRSNNTLGDTSVLTYMNGSTDYAEVYVVNSTGTSITGNTDTTVFEGYLLNGGGSGGSGGSTTTTISALTDVSLSNLSPTSILMYNGTQWVNKFLQDTVSTSTMTAGWPDAIKCTITSPAWGDVIFYPAYSPYASDGKYYYRANIQNGSAYGVVFTAAGAFSAYENLTTTNCNMSISSLYAAGRAFNNIGGSGSASSGYGLTSGTLGLTLNSPTSIISLTTSTTTWGYLGANASYLPNLSSNGISTTNITATTINGISISSLGGSASPTNVPAFRAVRSTSQAIAASTWLKVALDTKVFDTYTNFNTSTNRFVPTIAGYYFINASVGCTGTGCFAGIRKNGTEYAYAGNNNGTGQTSQSSAVIYMNGSTDYLELWAYSVTSGNVDSTNTITYLNGTLIASGNGLISGSSVGVSAIASLTDVSLSSLASNSILMYDGSKWVNKFIQDTVSTSTMLLGWPDAIYCNSASYGMRIMYINDAPSQAGTYVYRDISTAGYIIYNADGSYNTHNLMSATGQTCISKSITQLYSTNQAFNFIGGSGSGSGGTGYGLTSGTLGLTLNSPTSIISLTTGATTWGYLGSAASYIPNLSTNALTVGGLTINSTTLTSNTAQVAFSVHKNGTAQTVTAGTATKLTWSTKVFDTNNNFDLATGRFTPTVAGKYLITISDYCAGSTSACYAHVYKNGVVVQTFFQATSTPIPVGSVVVDMNGTTDYIEAYGQNTGGTSIRGDTTFTYFQGALLGGNGTGGVSGSSVGVSAIASLTDVSLSNLISTSILMYDGSKWVNKFIQDTVSTSTMVTTWPDAIMCSNNILYLSLDTNTSPRYQTYNGPNVFRVVFNSDKTFSASQQITAGTNTTSTWSSTCDNKTISQLYAANSAFNFLGTNSASSGTGYGLTSGTLGLTLNSPTSIISLTTGATTWGYFGSTASYLPYLNAIGISSTNITATTINGLPISSLGGSASPTNVPSFRVNKNGTNQTVAASTLVKVTFSTKEFDTFNNFDTGTSRFTPMVAGNYIFSASTYCGYAATTCDAYIYKNGVSVNAAGSNSVNDMIAQTTAIIPMNGTTDYVEAYVYMIGNTTLSGASYLTNFAGSLLASGNGSVSGTGVSTLSALTDVSLTGLATGNLLTVSGSQWVNTNSISVSTITLAPSATDVCTNANLGMIKMINGRMAYCRSR